MDQLEIDRCQHVGITGSAVAQVHPALFQREFFDDDTRQGDWTRGFRPVRLERGEQLGDIELAIGRNRQIRARPGDADFGKAPRAPDQGSPLQLRREIADGKQRRAIGLDQAEIGRHQPQREGIEADFGDRCLARQLGLRHSRHLVADRPGHQPESRDRIAGQQDHCGHRPSHPPEIAWLHLLPPEIRFVPSD
ncbi:MAG TPA: hypothetical protein VKP68_01140 [Ramlibacter sp.]|nr:hypothetical protein [Ramlibacter sp.]